MGHGEDGVVSSVWLCCHMSTVWLQGIVDVGEIVGSVRVNCAMSSTKITTWSMHYHRVYKDPPNKSFHCPTSSLITCNYYIYNFFVCSLNIYRACTIYSLKTGPN